MSFKSSRVSVPTAFASRGQASNRRLTPLDRLGVVVDYGQYVDATKRSFPTIVIRDERNGKLYEGRVSDASTERAKKSVKNASAASKSNFRGNIIDDQMQKDIPVGHRVVLEQCIPSGRINVGSEERNLVEFNYLTHVTEPAQNKAFYALYTMNAVRPRKDSGQVLSEEESQIRAKTIQVYDPTEFGVSSKDQDKLNAIAARLDEYADNYQKGIRGPGVGVRFRTVVFNPENADHDDIVDETEPMDWIRAERDERDRSKVIKEGRPLGGGDFLGVLEEYKEWVVSEDNPGRLSEDQIARGYDVEVLEYKNYLISGYSDRMVIDPDNTRHPLYRLCFTPTKCNPTDEQVIYGRNMAVSGIVFLTGDRFDKATGKIDNRNLVARTFFGGAMGNINSFIRTSTGKKAKSIPEIDNQNLLNRQTEGLAQGEEGQEQGQGVSQVPVDAFDDDDQSLPFAADEGSDFFDSILNEGMTDTAQAPVAEEKVETKKVEDKTDSSARRRGRSSID